MIYDVRIEHGVLPHVLPLAVHLNFVGGQLEGNILNLSSFLPLELIGFLGLIETWLRLGLGGLVTIGLGPGLDNKTVSLV